MEKHRNTLNRSLVDSEAQHVKHTADLQARLDSCILDVQALRANTSRHLAAEFQLTRQLHASESLVQELLALSPAGSHSLSLHSLSGSKISSLPVLTGSNLPSVHGKLGISLSTRTRYDDGFQALALAALGPAAGTHDTNPVLPKHITAPPTPVTIHHPSHTPCLTTQSVF